MTLDRNAVDKLLSLNDKQLVLVIKKLTAEAGIDPSALQINTSNIAALRAALSMATDADLQRATEQIAKMQRGNTHHG